MPKATASATATATVTTTHQVKLAPHLKRRLLTSLRLYGELATQMKALKLAMTKAKGNVEDVLVETGESSIALDGYKATYVSPVRTYLDKQQLILNGVSIAQIEASTVTKPGKPYTKVTLPGQKEDDDE